MSLPSTHELKDVITDILSSARDDGRLSQLTVRIVRQRLATYFNIKEDVLSSEKYKSFIKNTVHATVNSLQNASDEGTGSPERKAAKKEKASAVVKTVSRKLEAKVRAPSPDEAAKDQVDASASEMPSPPPRKAKDSARSKPSKPVKSNKTSEKPESEMKYLSKAIIDSSDEEGAPSRSKKQKSAPSPPKKEDASAKTKISSSKQKQKRVITDNSDIETNLGPSSSSSKPKHTTTESPRHTVSKAKESTRDPLESELSSVIDEPPKKRQKKQEKEAAKPEKEEKAKRGKKKEPTSKDEETINKLKGIVVACGVRKVWKKEFEGLDKPSQQLKRLHSILGDLGMTPRYSLDKAKAIREQRELAQELKDVQEFEKATKRRGTALRSSSETEEESPDQGGSDVDAPPQKKQNARASIMAFLQDQSDEE